MADMCGDNRFEIITRAKEHLLDATNIDTSEDEMKVLDSFLFRCWQMGWLDRYDRKTENSSEKPNNCEDEFFREPTAEEIKAVADYIDSISVPTGVNVFDFMDEPTISKMEQVDKPQTDCGDFAKARRKTEQTEREGE